MTEKTKTALNFIGRIVFSALLLSWLFSKIDWQETSTVVRSADIGYLFYALVLFLSIHIFLLIRWFVFIRALGLNSAPMEVVRYFFMGLFGNLFLPSAIGGDIIKILGLCRDSSQKAKVVASVLLDRLSGFAAITLVALTAFVAGFRYINDISLVAPILVLGVGSFVVSALLFNEKIYSWGCVIFNRLPKIKKKLMDLHYDIALMKNNKKEGVIAIGLACLCQIILAFVFFFLAKALRQDIPLVYFLIFVPLICVASSLPSIGGLGVREAGAAYLFAKVGVESGIAVSLSLINFLFMVFVGLIGGGFYVLTVSSRRVQHHLPDAPVEP